MRFGVDIGSTTIKCVLLDDRNNILYQSYQRHSCQIQEKLKELLTYVEKEYHIDTIKLAISGSAGMGIGDKLHLPFVQEVYATRVAAKKFLNDPDCIIELGGEDAKILFLTGGVEVRMNGTCAGGTGAFIDQMAQLLDIEAGEMNELSKKSEKRYTIASRCGVFAKSDIQPLINQGARKEDLSASIYQAVVNQTISGLAQGRQIEGRVVYLGGPLTFHSELRKTFDESLDLEGICPENSLYYVALGTALLAEEEVNIKTVLHQLDVVDTKTEHHGLKPLFEDEESYEEFKNRHARAHVNILKEDIIKGNVALGIDAGSTTLKIVLINEKEEIVYSSYQSNLGNTLELVLEDLKKLLLKHPEMHIVSSCVTGYGEELLKSAFGIDYGIVETMAHLKAAQKFMPNVDFIIDIGGQDIKCFKIKNGTIDNLFLNEACSSGCGSFLQTFANALHYDIESFSKLALFAKHPVDLGSRCTVFMNSSIKQAQKDGAAIEDISAGLSISVVKNALYKVIRADAKDLGEHIVVQGGTFYNDAVLRAFEMELKTNVIRPNIAGLMGAYGCALHALHHIEEKSSLLTLEELLHFESSVRNVKCGLCNNHCQLTVHQFGKDKRFISGNRCDRPVSSKKGDDDLNIYHFKREYLKNLPSRQGKRGKIGLPMALNMYELLPFWHRFFHELDFEVVTIFQNTLEDFHRSQYTIPSDTICFPAKMVHAAIHSLVKQEVPYIFYPCMTYNIKEENTKNHYNCPIVAYYPEVIHNNYSDFKNTTFIFDFIALHDRHRFPNQIHEILKAYFPDFRLHEIKHASKKAFDAYDRYVNAIKEKGKEIILKAELEEKEVIVLAGRPYHIEPLINHGIDKLLTSYDAAVISEDAVECNFDYRKLEVLNQWSYHSRLYSAAHYIKDKPHMNLIQLVSFGCGVDAITTDEVREILEGHGKIYTQLKIDEITNLGAVKIRLRSLFTALKQGDKHA